MGSRTYTTLIALFSDLDDTNVAISFTDGERRNLKIISVTHARLDSTVVAVPVDEFGIETDEAEPAVQFHLAEVAQMEDLCSGKLLYRKAVAAAT